MIIEDGGGGDLIIRINPAEQDKALNLIEFGCRMVGDNLVKSKLREFEAKMLAVRESARQRLTNVDVTTRASAQVDPSLAASIGDLSIEAKNPSQSVSGIDKEKMAEMNQVSTKGHTENRNPGRRKDDHAPKTH